MAILGVDFGLKRVGLAFAGDNASIAFAGPVFTGAEDEVIERIAGEADSRHTTTIVVGLPKNMDGTDGEMSARAQAFADKLREATGADVVMWDERLTSRQADRAMLSGDLSRKKRKKRIDSLAAQIMLQSYLDSNSKS